MISGDLSVVGSERDIFIVLQSYNISCFCWSGPGVWLASVVVAEASAPMAYPSVTLASVSRGKDLKVRRNASV